MRKRLFRLRQWGVAVLAGVTVLGAVSLVTAASASASLANSTVAAISTPNTVLDGSTNQAGSAWVITVPSADTVTAGDRIQITVNSSTGSCTSTNWVAYSTSASATATISTTGGATGTFSGTGTYTSASGCAQSNVLTYTASTTGSSTGGTITITPQYDVGSAAAAGNISVTGSVITGSTVSSVSFPANATVGGVTIASNSPGTNIAASSSNAAIPNISLTEPFVKALPTGFICVTLSSSSGATWNTSSATPAIAVTAGSGAATLANTTVTLGNSNLSLSFDIGTQSSTIPTTFTLSNLHVNTGSTSSGAVTFTVTNNSLANCTGTTLQTFATSPSSPLAFSSITVSQPYQGATADGTVAAEFEGQFSPNCTEGALSVVLATDVDPYDSLTAAYLAGELGTGLLITPQNTLGADAMTALRIMGVTTVYVVGGPLAVSSSIITQLQATSVYNCGGATLASSGAKITVANGGAAIYGQTADDTAKAIDTMFPATTVGSLTLTGAYNSTGGAYNDTNSTTTPDNGSSTGPTSNFKTAFLDSDTAANDAAAVAGIAYISHIPVILTPVVVNGAVQTSLGAAAASLISSLGIGQVIGLGGSLALPAGIVSATQSAGPAVLRVAGLDATDTAVQVAKFEFGSTSTSSGLGWTATGTNGAAVILSDFPGIDIPATNTAAGMYAADSLGAAALSGTNQWPILFEESPTIGLGTYTTAELKAAGNPSTGGISGKGVVTKIVILGGTLAVSAATASAATAALAAG